MERDRKNNTNTSEAECCEDAGKVHDASIRLADQKYDSTDQSTNHIPVPVFQPPASTAPRKTPKLAARSRGCATPRGIGFISSASRSRLNTPATSTRSCRTPKTSVLSDARNTTSGLERSDIVSIVEGRGLAKGEIGMASINLRYPVLQLSQFSDSQTYVKTITRLQMLSPLEIIFPNTMCDAGNMAKIFLVIADNFQDSKMVTVQRHYFNEAKGLDYVKQLCLKKYSSVEMDVQGRYYCLAAASALIKHVEFNQGSIYSANSLRISFSGSEQTTLIDANTAAALELTVNVESTKNDDTLFGILNCTKTTGGARLLRSNILQPPNDLETITLRHNCTQELTEDKELFYGLRACLERFDFDLDNLLSSLVQIPKYESEKTAENKITACVLLKDTLHLVPALREGLSRAKSGLFRAYHSTLQDDRFGVMLDQVLGVIHADAQYQKGKMNMKTQRCFAVKPEIHGLLDAARRTYTELIEDANDLTAQLSEKYSLALKLAHNASRGYFIQLPLLDKRRGDVHLPPGFLKVTTTKTMINFTTDDMICGNERINQCVRSIYRMANVIVSDLLKEIRANIGCLYTLSETISTLDMLLCFAHAATTLEYVRPSFSDKLDVKQGRHPVLERIIRQQNVIPNAICLTGDANFHLITGPNMSGKSTFLKQTALLQVMAQIGSFVPAEQATFRLADQIFSRVGSDDDIDTNASTFMLEMREVNYIIQNVANNSLVIIDELGRGTSSEEGVGLCWSIAEFLLMQKAYTLFATHFLELGRLVTIYPNVQNKHFKVDHVTTIRGSLQKVNYTYVLSCGCTSERHYGLRLAELFRFPPDVMPRAYSIAKQMEEDSKKADTVIAKQHKKEQGNYELASTLLAEARNPKLEGADLWNFFLNLRTRYLHDIPDVIRAIGGLEGQDMDEGGLLASGECRL